MGGAEAVSQQGCKARGGRAKDGPSHRPGESVDLLLLLISCLVKYACMLFTIDRTWRYTEELISHQGQGERREELRGKTEAKGVKKKRKKRGKGGKGQGEVRKGEKMLRQRKEGEGDKVEGEGKKDGK